MNPIIIDKLVKEAPETQCETSVKINGQQLNGWQIAKPCNYDKKYCTLKERLIGAWKVFQCKAIPVQFFCDLTEQEKIDYVKEQIGERLKTCDRANLNLMDKIQE